MHRVLFAALVVAPFAESPTVAARFRTEVVAITGDPSPDGNGSFSVFSFAPPDLNNAGQVAFHGFLTGVEGFGDVGIFRADTHEVVQIARTGQEAPDANGEIFDFQTPTLNDAGQVGFKSQLIKITKGFVERGSGVFRGDGRILQQIAREGQTVPDGNGRISIFGSQTAVSINNAGQVAFHAFLTGTPDGPTAIFRGDGGPLTQIARGKQVVPDGNGVLAGLGDDPKLNDLGQVAFEAFLADTTGGLSDDVIIFRSDGDTLTKIVREGQPTPDGDGSFSNIVPFISHIVLNDSGHVAFEAFLTGTSGGLSDNNAIYRGDGSTIAQIVRKGQPAPDGNGRFRNFEFPMLNNGGQTVFGGALDDTAGGQNDDFGIFRSSGDTLTQIARDGQKVPDGNGIFSMLSGAALLNDSGQVVFHSFLAETTGGSSDNAGIFFFDDLVGLMQVTRKGSSFMGSTITDFSFGMGLGPGGGHGPSGLNNASQIAYRFELADGRQGIAIATLIPEPSSFALLSLICLAALCSRRGARPQRW